MKKRILNQASLALVLSLTLPSWAAEQVNISWRYQNARDGQQVTAVTNLDVPATSGSLVQTDEAIHKTLYVIKLGTALKSALNNYACEDSRPDTNQELSERTPHPPCGRGETAEMGVECMPPPPDCPIAPPGRCRPPQPSACKTQRERVANSLKANLVTLRAEYAQLKSAQQDEKIVEVLDLTGKLTANMIKQADQPDYRPEPRPMPPGMPGGSRPAPPPSRSAPGRGGMVLTAGGAQDIAAFRKIVNDGYVPNKESLPIEGFLSEFDLSLSATECDALICMQPAVAVDAQAKKLYLQVGMNSNVTADQFKRRPLNLSVALDVSGSMSATDGTEKNRLEWAKEVLVKTVQELGEEDSLSIVLFDGASQILQTTTRVTDKAVLLQKISEVGLGGSTNLEAGLRDAYQLASANIKVGYENRVILISDAGLNTGAISDDILTKLVTDYAAEGIGLTAIGLGLNFNQEFVRKITTSQGGNYLFVNSGLTMSKLFANFDFLVSPVAYNFKSTVKIEGIASARLLNAYGVPAQREGQPAQELIDIRTLFFAGTENGGAILLEYQLP